MDISEFVTRHGRESRPIRSVLAEWQVGEIRALLEQAPGPLRGVGDAAQEGVGDAVLLGDLLRGQTLLDQLPKDLRQAFAALMKMDSRNVRGMRVELLQHLQDAHGDYMPFEDPRVVGFVSKIKGQIGENLFARHVGNAASLASSGSQEGWDVAVRQFDGTHHYVQVKLYQSPSGIVRHMRDVQQKILEGKLSGIDNEQVSQVFFAVPQDIRDDVLRLAARYDGLSSMLYEKSIPISASDAAGVVREGLSNVGPEQLEHFFGELLCGAAIAGSLHGLVNGFLWYKGSKELSAAVADAAADSVVSGVGVGIALLAESAFETAMMAGGIGMAARMFLKRAARSRWDFADFLERSLTATHSQLAGVASAEQR